MAQRLLTAFDTLDFYSKKILTKHGKNRQLGDIPIKLSLCTPLTSEDESELSLPSVRKISSPILQSTAQLTKEGHQVIPRQMRSAKSKSAATTRAIPNGHCGKPVIRPFSALEKQLFKSPNQKEKVLNTAGGSISVKQKKPKALLTSPRNTSARRPKWITEVEKATHFSLLWQENSHAHIGTALEYTGTSHWCTFTSANNKREETPISTFTDEKADQYNIQGTVGRVVAQQLQNSNKIHIAKNGHLQLNTPKPKTGRKENTSLGEDASKLEKTQYLKDCYPVNELKSKDNQERVPLSIEDQLEKPNVKILSPRAQKSEHPVLTVSETYPIAYYDDSYKLKLLVNSWTESHKYVQQSSNCLERTIKQETERYAARTTLKDDNPDSARNTVENTQKQYKQSTVTLKRKTPRKQKVTIHILSADGSRELLEVKEIRNSSTEKASGNACENETTVNKALLKPLPSPSCVMKYAGSADVRPVTNGIKLGVGLESETVTNSIRSVLSAVSRTRYHSGSQLISPSSLQLRKIPNSDHEPQRDYLTIAKPLKLQENERGLYPKKACTVTYNDTLNQILEYENKLESIALSSNLIRRSPDNLTHCRTNSPCNTDITYTQIMDSTVEIMAKNLLHMTPHEQKDGVCSQPLEVSGLYKSSPCSIQTKELEHEVEYRIDQSEEDVCPQTPASTPVHESSRPVINIPTASCDPLSISEPEGNITNVCEEEEKDGSVEEKRHSLVLTKAQEISANA